MKVVHIVLVAVLCPAATAAGVVSVDPLLNFLGSPLYLMLKVAYHVHKVFL